MPHFYFSFAKLAVRSARESERRKAPKMRNVVLVSSFDANELRGQVKRVEIYEGLSTGELTTH